jgi:hypothetical protein
LWQKFFSPLGYIGAVILVLIGLSPASVTQWLELHLSPEAISWISGDKARWAFVLGAGLLFAGTVYKNRANRQHIQPHLEWNIRVNDVLNYIVNDSVETFAAQRTITFRGSVIPASGIEYQSAILRLNERVASGRVAVSGYRETLPRPIMYQFENIRRVIPY